jgi:hypothetical protein
VPAEGRPALFLGGVGRFTVEAEAIPKVVRVGQELEFRLKVTGPAVWGMTDHPDLSRFERLPIRPRIDPKPDLTTDEPPSRTFVYRIQATRVGEAVLPPVGIASYDPALSRYLTRVTAGVPVRVVAVASFNPATIDVPDASPGSDRLPPMAWVAWISSAMLLAVAFGMLARVRRRLRLIRPPGPATARSYAARLARSLEPVKAIAVAGRPGDQAVGSDQLEEEPYRDSARLVSEELIRYLQLGIGRPPGALTPDEARQGVSELTGSENLGGQAGRLTARCDLVQYGHGHAARQDARRLIEDARGLFKALGRVRISRRRDRSASRHRP